MFMPMIGAGGLSKADSVWSLVFETTTSSLTFPAGIQQGDAVIFLGHSVKQGAPGQFSTAPGTVLAQRSSTGYVTQLGAYLTRTMAVSFVVGTPSLSGSALPATPSTWTEAFYAVFRRTPAWPTDPAIAYKADQVSTLAFASTDVPYAGDPSVLLGMATTTTAGATQSVTIGGVTPSVIDKSFGGSTDIRCRFWYRPNIAPATLTTVGTQDGTSSAFSGWTPFVIH